MLRGRCAVRWLLMGVMVMVIISVTFYRVKAEGNDEDDESNRYSWEQDGQAYDMSGLDEILKEKYSISFSGIFNQLRNGDWDGVCSSLGQAIVDNLVYEVRTNRVILIQIIAVIVLGSTFAQISGNIGE